MLWFSNFTKEEMVSHSLNGTCVPILVNCVYVWVSVHRERKSISIARIVKDMSTYISQRSLWYYISLLFLLALFLLCSSAWEYQFERPADSCIGTYSGMQQFLDWTVIMATTTPKCGHTPPKNDIEVVAFSFAVSRSAHKRVHFSGLLICKLLHFMVCVSVIASLPECTVISETAY